MAASGGDSSILEEELTCPVCLDLYRDPHLLPCGHNFCLPCLRGLKARSDHGRIRCPECRQSHRSSASWQKNFKLANITDSFRSRGQSERSSMSRSSLSHSPAEVRCDYCPVDDDESNHKAVKTCLKCEVSMCPKHIQPHLELPAFREHPLVEPLNDMKQRKCVEHDEMFRYYCVDERLFLCNACTIEGKHNGHSIKTLKNAMKDVKLYLDNELYTVNRKIVKAGKIHEEQKEIERQNKAYLDDTDRHLYSFRETSIAHLDAFIASMRDCVHTYNIEKGGGVQQNITRIAQDQTRLQEVRSGLERLLQDSDPFQLIRDYNSSEKRYRRLLRKPLFFPDEPTVDTEPLFEIMEGKMVEFIAKLEQHARTLVSTVSCFAGGDDEEEDEEDDDDDSFEDNENETGSEVEDEDEMRSEEEEEHNHNTEPESANEEYSPEEEEEEEEEEEDNEED